MKTPEEIREEIDKLTNKISDRRTSNPATLLNWRDALRWTLSEEKIGDLLLNEEEGDSK